VNAGLGLRAGGGDQPLDRLTFRAVTDDVQIPCIWQNLIMTSTGTGFRASALAKPCGLQKRFHQGKDALLFGKATEEQEIRPCPSLRVLKFVRVRHTSAHRYLRISQEVLHRNGLSGKATFIELALHELRWRNNQINFTIRMVEFQEFGLHGGQGALGTGTFHTHVLRSMYEMFVQAGVADLSPAIHHRIGRAQQNVIMRRIHHRHMMFLQIRCIKNRKRQLAMHIVHVDHIWLEFL